MVLLNHMDVMALMAIVITTTTNISNTVFFEESKKAIKEWNLFLIFLSVHMFEKMC